MKENLKKQEPTNFDLTCWYINARRVIELVGAHNVADDLKPINALSDIDDAMRQSMALSVLKNQITEWIQASNPPTLGQLICSGNFKPNTLFTHFTNYYCKGLSQVSEALHKNKPNIPMAEIYAKLDELGQKRKIHFRYHHEHLTSASAWCNLSGQKQLLVLGMATDIQKDRIEAIPWIIANPLPDLFRSCSIIGKHLQRRLEIHPDSIDNFSRVRDIPQPRSKKVLEQLRDIPENDVKQAFAEILSEQTVLKDWGGERSDLFTTHIKLNNERISTAIAFKGPAKFHPMTVADLGKNGDQIDRLFTEPADLLILQHCHEIMPPVRNMMRAYAQQMGNPRLCCIINGYDTWRILKAYGKCGIA